MADKFTKGDQFQIKISSLGYGGEGVGKANGMVFFVPRALPGDLLLVAANRVKKRYGSAAIIEILEPSPGRRPSRCKFFEMGCGGCQWLHLDYQEQLRQKTQTVREMMKRVAKISATVEATIPSSHLRHSRNKLSVRVGENGRIGLSRENSHEILDLDECMMETRENLAVFEKLRSADLPEGINQIHLRSSPDGKVAICLFADEYDESYKEIEKRIRAACKELAGFSVKTRGRFYHVGGPKHLRISLGGVEYRLPAGGFFQTNYQQASVLLDQVIKAAAPRSTDTVLDLYCGIGFFTLPLARLCGKSLGIEFDRTVAKAASDSARANGIENVRFESGDVKKQLSRISAGEYQIVVLDPPRSGCHPSVIDQIVRLQPEKVVYVSCAPDTLARDLERFSKLGYTVGGIRPVDMFPQTYHVEVVATLTKKAKS